MVHPGGRPKNPIFWRHVEEIDAKKVKCKRCGKEFAKSRIKTHLTGEGKGVLPCKPNVIELVRNEVAAGEHGNAGVNDNNNINIDVMNPGMDMEAAYDGAQAMPDIVIQSNLDPAIQSMSRADNMGLGADDNAATHESTGEDVCAVTGRDAAVFLPPIASQNMSQPSCMVGIDLDPVIQSTSRADNAATHESTGEDVCAVTTSRDAAVFLQPIASQNVPAGEKLPATASRDAAEPAWVAAWHDLPRVYEITWPSYMDDFDRTFNKEYVVGEANDAADPSHSDSVKLSRDYLNTPSGQTESSPKDPPVSSNFAAKSPSHECSPQDPPGLGADDNAATHESTGEDVCAVTTSRDAAVFLQPIASQNVPAGEKLPATASRDAAQPAWLAALRDLPRVYEIPRSSYMDDFDRTFNKEYVVGEANDAADPSHSDSVKLSRDYLNTPSGQTESSPKDPPVSSNFAAKSPSHECSPQDPPGLGADDNAATHESTGEDVCAVTSRDAAVFLQPIASQNVPAGEKLPATASRDAAQPAWLTALRDMPRVYEITWPSYMDDFDRTFNKEYVVGEANDAADPSHSDSVKLSRDYLNTPSGQTESSPKDPPVSSNFAAKSPSHECSPQDPPGLGADDNAATHESTGEDVCAVTSRDAAVFLQPIASQNVPVLQNEEPADMEGCNSFSEHRIDAAFEVPSINVGSSRLYNQVHLQAMQNPNKRVRLQDSSLASSSIDAETIAKRAVEENVAEAFLKLLYCNNVPSIANDLVKDPLYMEFVERAFKLGFQSSLVWGDSRFITRTVSRIEGEVNEYIDHVKESWKTTGCTVMLFNLQLLPNREDVTTAFYCPKGVFFVQGNVVEDFYAEHVVVLSHSYCIKLDNFKGYLECLFDEEYGSFEAEEEYIGEDNLCELTDLTISEMQNRSNGRALCIRNKIQYWCIIICHRSEWADNLISIAGQIHTFLCSSRQIQSWYYKMLTRKRSSFKVLANNHCPRANRLAIFISILSMRNELSAECKLHSESYIELARDEIRAITNGSTFWSEGWKLELMLKCVMKIGNVMDTFVPTAGYLGMALNEVPRHLEPDMGEGALLFWKKLGSGIGLSYLENEDNYVCLDVSYLNPVYYLQQLQTDSKAQEDLKKRLNNKYNEEVDRYADEFRKVPANYKLEQHHPVEVWEKYGKSLPNLQRIAIKGLSQPLSCMCKQVKKHLYQLEGAEDYILRLNVRMMQHFKLLGDDIYKPLNLSPLTVVLYGLQRESESELESE